MKLINFTIANAILMVVNLVEFFLFTTCIPIVHGTYGGEQRCLWMGKHKGERPKVY